MACEWTCRLDHPEMKAISFPVAADESLDNPLAVEILAEKASAYFATVRKLKSALNALSRFENDHKTPIDSKSRVLREDLVAEAAERAWIFLIQREAMKLPYYEELFVDFEIPDEVRKRMGPRDRSLRAS